MSGKLNGQLRECLVHGKPTSSARERYGGHAADIEALLDAREGQMLPERTRHLDFGAVAAAWGCWPVLRGRVPDDHATARPQRGDRV